MRVGEGGQVVCVRQVKYQRPESLRESDGNEAGGQIPREHRVRPPKIAEVDRLRLDVHPLQGHAVPRAQLEAAGCSARGYRSVAGPLGLEDDKRIARGLQPEKHLPDALAAVLIQHVHVWLSPAAEAEEEAVDPHQEPAEAACPRLPGQVAGVARCALALRGVRPVASVIRAMHLGFNGLVHLAALVPNVPADGDTDELFAGVHLQEGLCFLLCRGVARPVGKPLGNCHKVLHGGAVVHHVEPLELHGCVDNASNDREHVGDTQEHDLHPHSFEVYRVAATKHPTKLHGRGRRPGAEDKQLVLGDAHEHIPPGGGEAGPRNDGHLEIEVQDRAWPGDVGRLRPLEVRRQGIVRTALAAARPGRQKLGPLPQGEASVDIVLAGRRPKEAEVGVPGRKQNEKTLQDLLDYEQRVPAPAHARHAVVIVAQGAHVGQTLVKRSTLALGTTRKVATPAVVHGGVWNCGQRVGGGISTVFCPHTPEVTTPSVDRGALLRNIHALGWAPHADCSLKGMHPHHTVAPDGVPSLLVDLQELMIVRMMAPGKAAELEVGCAQQAVAVRDGFADRGRAQEARGLVAQAVSLPLSGAGPGEGQ
mmetsp:Transcript_112268/g.317576  ORF Transcript_112268/g.317576 Transcript_112268/m.317576 type:complete len:591 (+) Transcript_112268:1192-2964(+)